MTKSRLRTDSSSVRFAPRATAHSDAFASSPPPSPSHTGTRGACPLALPVCACVSLSLSWCIRLVYNVKMIMMSDRVGFCAQKTVVAHPFLTIDTQFREHASNMQTTSIRTQIKTKEGLERDHNVWWCVVFSGPCVFLLFSFFCHYASPFLFSSLFLSFSLSLSRYLSISLCMFLLVFRFRKPFRFLRPAHLPSWKRIQRRTDALTDSLGCADSLLA